MVEVHESLLYHILPFLWGGDVSKGILKDVVTYVGSLLSEPKIVAIKKELKMLKAEAKRVMEDNESLKAEVKKMRVLKMENDIKIVAANEEVRKSKEDMERMKRELREIKGLLEEVAGKGGTDSSFGARRSARKRGRKSGE